MSTDSPKPTQEFTQEYFDALQAKLDRDIRENPASVDPNIIILTKQHARLHQTLNAQAKAYTNLVEMHIRREEIAILEKLEFAETIKAYQLRLMEGKKLKNRKERLQEIEKTYEKKRQEAQTCTQNLKNVVGSLSDIRAGMQAFVGEQIGFPESLRALSRSLNGTEDTPPSSTPSSSSPSIPQPRGPLPAMLLAVQDHRLERKEVEILNLKMRLAQYQRTGGPKEVSTTAENGEKSEISVNTGSGSVYTNLTNEELNEHVVRCYSALACYQKANSGLIDQLVLVEKTAYMDRMKAADKIQELQYDVLKAKKLHGQNKLMHEVKMEFVETMKGIEEKIEKSREDVRFLRDGLEQLCLETFGETKRVVDDVDWISTRNMNEAYKHKPEPTETDAHLAEKKKELARLKEELKALETAYEATL
ncbi:hypothetical protein L3Y34_005391 [Caenorhabditis briggsae]|nr:hypothetical protein L3Y34_005391 [Caenorhabditis briggsae]